MATNQKAGRFNKQITFSTITKVDDGYGGFTATYAPYATVWAYIKPLSLNEQLIRGQESGTTTYDVWVINTGDYNFTRQMKVTYGGKEFVINSVVDQDEADRYFVFTMSSKDDVTTPKPHIINALTDFSGQIAFINFDTEMNNPQGNEGSIWFNSSTFDEPFNPESMITSDDGKSFLITFGAFGSNIIPPDIDLTVTITGGVFTAVNGQTLDTVDEYYVQNNTDL